MLEAKAAPPVAPRAAAVDTLAAEDPHAALTLLETEATALEISDSTAEEMILSTEETKETLKFNGCVLIYWVALLILFAALPETAEIPARIRLALNKMGVTYHMVGPQDPLSYSWATRAW